MLYPDRSDLTRLATTLGGLPVLACHPGSPAERAGICYGDILLAVNGVRTPDWAAFIQGRSKSNTTMALELFRDGNYLSLEIELSSSPIDPPTLLAEMIAQHIVPLPVAFDERKHVERKPN